MTDDFVQPSISTGVDLQTLNGSLLVISVLSFEDHVPTVHTLAGEKTPAVKGDVYVLDGAMAGKEYLGTLLFGKVLQSQLKDNIGRKVLGRLGLAEAKAGKNAAWTLALATPDDFTAARNWNARRQNGQSQPAANTASRAPF